MKVLGARGVRVLAGEHADARRTALWTGTECSLDPESCSCQAVDVRGPNEAIAVHTDVAPAQVIGEKNDDVWTRVSTGLCHGVLREDNEAGYY
jgi:hypothetical protein